jgi:hypothetical protein
VDHPHRPRRPQHLGDFDPNDPGLEYFKVSESSGQPSSLRIEPANGTVN